MRLSSLSLWLGLASLGAAAGDNPAKESKKAEPEQENTYFNGKKVPPLLELTPDNFEKEANNTKFMLVKHYSPYCHHCATFAPTFQTLYEFYYTSKPEVAASSDSKDAEAQTETDFTSFYDFKFATVNCIAYFDVCSNHGVQSYPTTVLYKEGEAAETFRGVKNITLLSETVEAVLEQAKPGTRPAKLSLPEAGDKASPGVSADSRSSSTSSSGPKDGQDGKAEQVVEKAGVIEKSEGSGKSEKSKESEKSKKSEQSEKTEKTKKADQAPIEFQGEHTDKGENSKKNSLKKPTKPSATPNPNGLSVSLTAETFQTLVTMTQEPWFIKFYAPWCHHCQAMAANWQQLAKEMKGRLNIGEVNCDVETRLCKDVRLRGYPTILFFRGGERVEYDGLRGLGDFIHYAEKAISISSGVTDVEAASFEALEQTEEVIFVYFYDHATTSEDFIALERLSLSLIGHARLVKTRDPKLSSRFKITTWPRLIVVREGRPTYYTPLTPRDMRDTHKVLGWMKSVWLPIVAELTASNAREVMDGKLVVLGILNREDQEGFMSARREMKSAANEWMDKQILAFQHERKELRDAKQLRIEEAEDRGDQNALRRAKSIRINMDKADRKEVAFAWVDGVFWQRWIRTTYGIDVQDGERVIINDEDNRRYWDQTITGNYILPSRTSILETINKVTQSPPKIKPKLTISSFEKIFFDMRVAFSEHPYLTLGCIFGLTVGAVSWFRGRLRRSRGHFRLGDDNIGIKEYKPSLLGNNANGKVD